MKLSIPSSPSLLLALLLSLTTSPDLLAGRGPHTFIESDDYRDGEEVVGVFLDDSEYARMVEGLEFRGVELDWAWIEAEYRKPARPLRLLFQLSDFETVRVPTVSNHSPAVAPGLENDVRELFVEAMQRLGLRLVGDEEPADLELGVAIVDYKADGTYIFFGTIDPFIELEIRLRAVATGEPLLLIRNQDHNSTPVQGAADTAGALIRILQ